MNRKQITERITHLKKHQNSVKHKTESLEQKKQELVKERNKTESLEQQVTYREWHVDRCENDYKNAYRKEVTELSWQTPARKEKHELDVAKRELQEAQRKVEENKKRIKELEESTKNTVRSVTNDDVNKEIDRLQHVYDNFQDYKSVDAEWFLLSLKNRSLNRGIVSSILCGSFDVTEKLIGLRQKYTDFVDATKQAHRSTYGQGPPTTDFVFVDEFGDPEPLETKVANTNDLELIKHWKDKEVDWIGFRKLELYGTCRYKIRTQEDIDIQNNFMKAAEWCEKGIVMLTGLEKQHHDNSSLIKILNEHRDKFLDQLEPRLENNKQRLMKRIGPDGRRQMLKSMLQLRQSALDCSNGKMDYNEFKRSAQSVYERFGIRIQQPSDEKIQDQRDELNEEHDGQLRSMLELQHQLENMV